DLMRELTPGVTIVIVTHNLQQARRVGDFTAFLTSEPERDGALVGRLVEFGTTERIFSHPAAERTEAYVSGRFGRGRRGRAGGHQRRRHRLTSRSGDMS